MKHRLFPSDKHRSFALKNLKHNQKTILNTQSLGFVLKSADVVVNSKTEKL